MRICLVYDCLFPHTVGGAERWYANLARRLSEDGHHVTYLTLRQWEADDGFDAAHVVAVGPRLRLYKRDGRRRILPPIAFGLGVLAHLVVRGRRYDVVHTASFPYFSLLAAAAVRPVHGFRLVVDWHEVWTRSYWREYLGPVSGWVGWLVQRLCLRVPQRAFCFAQLHAERLRGKVNGDLTVLEGEYDGPSECPPPQPAQPVVVYAGRHIPEKRVPALVPAVARAREAVPELRAVIFGDGPDRPEAVRQVEQMGLTDVVSLPGFVDTDVIDRALATALCLVLPSQREGYGVIVVEAAARGTPSVLVRGADNAATELVYEGINGYVAETSGADDLAEAILAIHRAGHGLRETTAEWFALNSTRLSLRSSMEHVSAAYTA